MKLDLQICTFTYGRTQDPDTAEWITQLRLKVANDERIGRCRTSAIDDTPITMTRNLAIKTAKDDKFDLLLMVDSDMAPDAYLGRLGAKPFWDSSFEFMLHHNGPCIIAAPYCGPPPEESVYIFDWRKRESGAPDKDAELKMMDRERAASMRGMWEAAALPTGLMLIDMRVIDKIPTPWFDYEYKDEFNTEKASTEDVYFTRNASLAGVRIYSNWDAWAGHWKRKKVGPPEPWTPDMIRKEFRESVANNRLASNQSLIFLRSKNGDRRKDEHPLGPVRQGPDAPERSDRGVVGAYPEQRDHHDESANQSAADSNTGGRQ